MSKRNAAMAPAPWGARLRMYGKILQILSGMALARVLRKLMRAMVMPRPQWEPLPGPNQVGVCDVDLLDLQRPEPEHPNEARRILARIWYPAAPNALPRRRFHAPEEAAWLEQHGPRSVKDLRELSDVETWSAQDAPALQSVERFPVLLFSHGLGGTVSQNTHLCERLASSGYIVVSITHPYGGSSVRYATGGEALMSSEMARKKFDLSELGEIVTQVRLARTPQAAMEAARKQLSVAGLQAELRIWADDTSAVLNLLREGKTAPVIPEVLGLADFSRVGTLGMSFGGAASAAAAQRDQRIGAAVNLDGNQFGNELWNTTIRAPLLELRSDDGLIDSGGSLNNFHYEEFSEAGTSGKVWRYWVEGSTHGGFTDMVLLGTALQRRLMHLGRVPGTYMTALMVDLVRRFFDRHLKGAPAAWPADPSATWPELRRIDTQVLRELVR